jgi:hypothetical protein
VYPEGVAGGAGPQGYDRTGLAKTDADICVT